MTTYAIATTSALCVNGPLEPNEFYHAYAAALGIGDKQGYAAIMRELDELDDLARNKVFNIGFCVNSCWINPGLRWTHRWDAGCIDEAKERYGQQIQAIENCLPSAIKIIGREHLRFLKNRLECTIIQLEVARLMKSLSTFCDHTKPDALTDQEKETVSTVCDQAMTLAHKYVERHAQQIVDRGCEGTLINYFVTIPYFIDHIRTVFVEGETECTHILPRFDEPPAPMIV